MAVRGFRQSGEFKESKGFGPAGAGLRDEKQKERGRQAGKELKEALERGRISPKGTEYTGELAEAMRTANIDQFNRRQLSRRAAEESPRPSIMQGIRGLTSQLSPQRLIGSVIGNALLPGIGGLLGGIIGGTYADDDPSNNFFGNIGASLRKDVRDTINFFRPEQFVTPPLTESTSSMFPIQNVTETTNMPGMEQIPDMFPDNFGVPTYGLDDLMQPTDEGLSIKASRLDIPDDMMFRAQVNPLDNPIATSGTLFGANVVPGTSLNNPEFAIQPVSDTGGPLTFGPTVFGEEGFESLIAKGLTPVTVETNMTPAFLRRDR
jgi:hypothetical protein